MRIEHKCLPKVLACVLLAVGLTATSPAHADSPYEEVRGSRIVVESTTPKEATDSGSRGGSNERRTAGWTQQQRDTVIPVSISWTDLLRQLFERWLSVP